LFKLFLQRYHVDDDINTKILGRITKGYSGYDIKKVVKYAKHLAIEDDMGITMHHLETAVNDIRPSLSREILEPIKHFFINNKRGLIGSEPDHEIYEPRQTEDQEIIDSEDMDFEISIDDELDDEKTAQVIDWEGMNDKELTNEDSEEEEDEEEKKMKKTKMMKLRIGMMKKEKKMMIMMKKNPRMIRYITGNG
jgi:ATP-dependent 26S proteasome regulatory subunit